MKTEKQIDELLSKDPVAIKAIEFCDNNNTLIKDTVDELLTTVVARIDNEEDKDFNLEMGILSLGRALSYLMRSTYRDKEEFDTSMRELNVLVPSKVMPSLDSKEPCKKCANCSDNEECHKKSGFVFDYRNLTLVSTSLIEYINWRNNLAISKEFVDKEKTT